jgi:CRP/FNR family cyclic AMP-dependent transcriptional regulator
MSPFESACAASDRTVRLLDVDTELFAWVDADALARADELTVETLRLQPGRWTPSAELRDERLGFLVLDGVLVRTVSVLRQCRSELIGEGDVIRPEDTERAVATVPFDVEWEVLQPARLARLDDAFFATAGRFPEVNHALNLRVVQRSHRLALQFAISDVRQIHDRLVALFLHLGDRWGRMTPDGIHVPLPLTHDLIAQLAGAQRPTVTRSLGHLSRAGRLDRRPDRTWLVRTPAGRGTRRPER